MNNFDLIAGYGREKEELRKICDILNNRDVYLSKGAAMPKGVIFYGDSGNGKTLFAHVLAKECDMPIYIISLGETSKRNGVIKQIKTAFDKANRSKRYSVVFIDELDKILPKQGQLVVSDGANAILTELLTLIDGIDKNNNVFFIATCNDFYDIPETMLRPGRIDKKIMLPDPDCKSRKEILAMYIKQSNCAFEASEDVIASFTAGMSCSALKTLINECILESDENNFVSEKLVFKKLNEINHQDIERERSTIEKMIFSCHNLGYFIVANSFAPSCGGIIDMDSHNLCNDFFNGIVDDVNYDDDYDDDDEDDDDDYNEEDDCDEDDDDYDDDDDCDEDELKEENDNEAEDIDDDDEQDDDEEDLSGQYYSETDYRNAICVLCGGMIAEKYVLQKTYDDTAWDLDTIDNLLFRMSEMGMLGMGLIYNVSRHKNMPYSADRLLAINNKFDEIISECYEKAEKIISQNVDLIKLLQCHLIEEGLIKKERVKELIDEFKNQKAFGGNVKDEKESR